MLKVFLVGFAETLIYLIRPNKLKLPFWVIFIEGFESTYKT